MQTSQVCHFVSFHRPRIAYLRASASLPVYKRISKHVFLSNRQPFVHPAWQKKPYFRQPAAMSPSRWFHFVPRHDNLFRIFAIGKRANKEKTPQNKRSLFPFKPSYSPLYWENAKNMLRTKNRFQPNDFLFSAQWFAYIPYICIFSPEKPYFYTRFLSRTILLILF